MQKTVPENVHACLRKRGRTAIENSRLLVRNPLLMVPPPFFPGIMLPFVPDRQESESRAATRASISAFEPTVEIAISGIKELGEVMDGKTGIPISQEEKKAFRLLWSKLEMREDGAVLPGRALVPGCAAVDAARREILEIDVGPEGNSSARAIVENGVVTEIWLNSAVPPADPKTREHATAPKIIRMVLL